MKLVQLLVTNLIKIVEDSISELLGIPDQNNWKVFVTKTAISKTEQEYFKAHIGTLGSIEMLNYLMEAYNE